jgi:hypothetical protein
MRKVLTPPKRPKGKNSIKSDTAYRRKQLAEHVVGNRGTFTLEGGRIKQNPRGFIAENLPIPSGGATRENKVRWKKPSPIIKRTTRTAKRK